MPEETIKVPEHYKLVAEEIKPLIKEIQDAFINKPVPSGYNYQGFNEVVKRFANFEKPIKEIITAVNDISTHILPEDKAASSEDIHSWISRLSLPIREVISCFHNIWKRPFEPDIADGQPILSAVPEMIIRKCLTAFEQIIDVVENPEEMIKRHSKQKFYIDIVFGSEEAELFSQWLDRHQASLTEQYNASIIQEEIKKRSWLTPAIFGFLLGYWMGNED